MSHTSKVEREESPNPGVLILQHRESSLNLHVLKDHVLRMIELLMRIQNHVCTYIQRTLDMQWALVSAASSSSLRTDDPQPVRLREWPRPSSPRQVPGCSPSPSLICAKKSLSCFRCVHSCASLGTHQKCRLGTLSLPADFCRGFCSPALPSAPHPGPVFMPVQGVLLPQVGLAFL